jgi:two-component system CheB/CheR fusion protein
MSPTPSADADGDSLAELQPSLLRFPVVGLGGSAGGLQALMSFFEHMTPRPGMAFVVILHLSPHHESNAAQLLQQVTPLPVLQVTDSVPVEIDHVYVIAPRSDLQMNDGHLQVLPHERAIGRAVAIDMFFRTLAQVHRKHAFSIVLSGTGSDGAVGIARVKAQGGITLAQAPDDAQYGDMPRAAIATGMVDLVLPVAGMGRRLVALWASARRLRLPRAEAGAPPAPAATPEQPAPAHRRDILLNEILALLRVHTRHDFRRYKRGTVLRRIERRLQVNELTDLGSYRDFLHGHPQEALPLLQDMLISVTSFFRDPEAFEALARDVVPDLVRHALPGEAVRVWDAGCATGEESYSLVMLLRDAAEAQGRALDAQVFATDIDERALAVARRGIYPGGIAADVPPMRLRRHFVREQDRFRVQAGMREQVLFASHNLLHDPPFSRLDLICCRNLLIYLEPGAQVGVLEMFHYALKPGGHLFLGASESVDVADTLFETVDKQHRIYRARDRASWRPRSPGPAAVPRIVPPPPPPPPAPDPVPVRVPVRRGAWEGPAADMHLHALQAVSPASVLIDGRHQILHLSPTAGRYMRHAGGVPSNDLLHNVETDLRLELGTALFQAERSRCRVDARLTRTRADGGTAQLRLTVHPLPGEATTPTPMLVVFDEPALPDDAEGGPGARDALHQVMLAHATQEIQRLKVDLQDTLERSALSTEELKGANEELQAINEELRSATEELQTSREELQSINEELTTVNQALRLKVEERGQINDDLQNFITASDIATVFVDSALRVKRFTPQARTVFNLIASDAGRPLTDITHRLDYEALERDAQSVFESLRPIERRVTTDDRRHLLARILPYRTAGDRIEGIVLTFVDITRLHLAEERVRATEERLRGGAAAGPYAADEAS